MSEQRPEPEIIIAPQELAGRWANLARVSSGEHEFTIDFIRMDPRLPRGIVVSRISGSPLFMMELIDILRDVWQTWAEKALPKEARGDVPPDGEGA